MKPPADRGSLYSMSGPESLLELIEDLDGIICEAEMPGLRISYVSSAAEALLGYSRDQWLSQPDFLTRHIHPDDQGLVVDRLRNGAEGGQPYAQEFRIYTADGRIAWFRGSFRFVPGENGSVQRLRAILIDITPLQRASEAFRESQKRYRHLVDNASEVIYRTDALGFFTFFNPAVTRVLKHPVESLIGKHYLELVRPDYRAQVRRFYFRQLRDRIPTSYCEAPALTADAGYVWLGQNVQLVLDGDNVVGFQAIARDLTELKRWQEALLESEERYRIVAETATDAIITVDEEIEILFLNTAAEKIFGYGVDEMVGQPLTMLIPTYPRRFYQSFARFDLNTGRGFYSAEAVELTGRHKDGREVPLEVSLGEFTESGRHLFTAVVRDITERKRVEEALRHSDERFRSLIENTSDIIAIVDLSGRFKYLSPSLTRMLGYDPLQIAGTFPAGILHPDDRERIAEACTNHLRNGQPLNLGPMECRCQHRDGTWRVLEGIAQDLSDSPTLQGILINLRDVTDRKRDAAELWAANETLRSLIQASPVAILGLDKDGNITKWTSAAERLFGWTEEEVLGGPLPFLDERSEADFALLWATLDRGESFTVERNYRTRSGNPVLIGVSAAPLRESDGSVFGAVAVLNDITERRRLEDQLRQAQKMEAVGQLAGGVAHDFNNLLTVITGYTQLLLASMEESDRTSNYALEIQRAAERAASLTRQLLAFSRRQVAQPQTLDVNQIVSHMTQMLRRLISEQIQLDTHLPPLRGRVHIDPGHLEQILMNLAVNARDAMTSGGRLLIETADVHLGPEYTRQHVSSQPGPHILLAVSDTGPGMTPEVRRRIFEPFFTTKELGKGTGLGLSTVYGIVKQNNANIWVYSEPGMGTTFKIYFPVVATAARAGTTVETYAALKGTETILIVEDEAGLRELVQELLKACGYEVLVAASGEEALWHCREHKGFIHLLLTDVVMPDTSGPLLVNRLRPVRPHMRILYMSGYPDSTLLHHGVMDPGVHFLQKPFSREALGTKVREVLDAPMRSFSNRG